MFLNNHGWSLKQMILCCAIILIALFFVVFYSQQLMKEFGESFKESVKGQVTYATIERNVGSASLLYMEKYYDNEVGTGTITILTNNLISYNLLKEDDLITSEKDSCTGYALIRKNEKDNLYAEAYIKCSDYITDNFQYWRMGE